MKTPVRKYNQWLGELKSNICRRRLQTELKANNDMLILYWFIGKQVTHKIEGEGWGTKVIDQLSGDVQKEFPDMQAFSISNLMNMQKYVVSYSYLLIVQQPFTQFSKKIYYLSNPVLISIPCGHHVTLMDKKNNYEERFWYINKTIENNWSRAVLHYQIDTNLYLRQHKTKKAFSFHLTLPKPQAELANKILKNTYIFRFPQMGKHVSEIQLEDHLIKQVQQFIMEMGASFAFAGRQVKLMTGKKGYFVDLLFYHLYLRSIVVIDLKMDEFEMAHIGKMNGCLNMVNRQLRHQYNNPSIGIILCDVKDNVEVDYAKNNINHLIGVSEYTFSKLLSKNFKDKLPATKQLQDEINRFLKKINTKTTRSAKRK